MRWTLRLLTSLALGVLLAGCKPELASIEITMITDPPLPVTVSPQQIRIVDGIAIAIDVVGINDEGETEDNLSIATTFGAVALGWIETKTPDRFILYGISPGAETLSFSARGVNGTVDVPVTTEPQP